ncbi:carbohydrate ABC transporter permease [Streptococcus cuniculi]|uniref:Carbohydrate ABC transporter permease n=1 Tax=Streptococcus cuniculi TaxID=1432788 RepID=A0A4Y9JGA8_9STRE|nr:carbohydrate ABC transporter permease [Streptococcus cuniculi]MBF0777322.1 carbohydrate ABC transporter permease [Streptococcus cuniculi]TFU98924.1 carbohydrate ABC transporter permease [Streptococcus cuniculi]
MEVTVLKTTKTSQAFKVLLYVILIGYAFVTFYPFMWAVSASFKPLSEITSGDLSILSKEFTVEQYRYLFSPESGSMFVQWFLNSLIISTIGTAINLFLNTMAGYSLARLRYPGRSRIYYGILAMMMVPTQVLLIPNYLIISNLGLLDSYWALVLPAAVNIGNIFMMRQFFLSFPTDIEEAASIDGLSRTGTFFRIVMPLARPSIATQSVFVFMGFWNNFMAPMLYLKTQSKFTLTVGLQLLQKADQGGQMWNRVMAASVLTILPIIVLYIIFNRYFLQGVRMDGEK